nr:hypothetical protein HmN_000707500 [Hymenolepis microstoma]
MSIPNKYEAGSICPNGGFGLLSICAVHFTTRSGRLRLATSPSRKPPVQRHQIMGETRTTQIGHEMSDATKWQNTEMKVVRNRAEQKEQLVDMRFETHKLDGADRGVKRLSERQC